MLSATTARNNQNIQSYAAALAELGQRARRLRIVSGFQQRELAKRAGVTVGTVQRFERTGRASMESVLRVAHALRAEGPFQQLFAEPAYATLDEALAAPKLAERQRVRRKR